MSALRWLFRTGGRGSATFVIWAIEALIAWSFAAAMGSVLASPLLSHPWGVFALYGEDGRLFMDFLRVNAAVLRAAGHVAAAVLALWAVAGVALGGVIPLMGASRMAMPTVPNAFAESLRRSPTLIALSLLATVGYGLVALLAWLAWSSFERASLHAIDARAVDLRFALIALSALLLAALVRAWHAVARFHAMGRRYRALAAAGSSVAHIARSPIETLGRAALWALVAACGTLFAFGLGAALDRHRAAWAVVALSVAQQLSVLWRVHCRMRWYAGLSVEEAGEV